MGLLDGRVAIITGASKGIGLNMSQRFAAEGARVVCAARTKASVEEVAERIRKAGGQAVSVAADAATEEGARQAVATAVQTYGRLDTLVNNAGDGGPTKPVQDYLTEDWFYTINSCLTSSYMMIRFAVPAMIKAGGGAIINISSMAGRRGLAYRIGYCSAKAGQVGMAYGLALELAPHNIRINVVAPGAVEGDRIDSVIAGQAAVRGVTPEQIRKGMLERSPLKRMVTADDITAAALFLCSEQARNISGQCIPVNAGEPAG
jgi:NAD(P)-dependent dehydrogenase (short-subunit alcohol dehydrogenase family)